MHLRRYGSFLAAIVSGSILAIGSAQGTPDIGIRQRRIVLGYSADTLYALLMERTNPSSYYEDRDSLFICRHDPERGSELSRELLSAIVFQDTTRELTGRGRAGVGPMRTGQELATWLVEHRIQYAYPAHFGADGYRFEADSTDIYLASGEQRTLLMNSRSVLATLGICQVALRPVECYFAGHSFFLLVEYERYAGFDQLQSIIPISFDRIQAAQDSLRKRSRSVPMQNDREP